MLWLDLGDTQQAGQRGNTGWPAIKAADAARACARQAGLQSNACGFGSMQTLLGRTCS